MKVQFLGKTAFIAFAGCNVLFFISLISYFVGGSGVWLLVLGGLAFAVSVYRLEWGMFIVFFELFINPHGQAIFFEAFNFLFSLRMVIFMAVMLAWFIVVLKRRYASEKIFFASTHFLIFIPLLLAISIGFVVGIQKNAFLSAFQDGNAYLYIAYLAPLLSIPWSPYLKNQLLQILFAVALWVSLLSLLILLLFTHAPENILQIIYIFFRDTRWAEITNAGYGIFRVFIQSQFYVIVAFLLAVALYFQSKTWLSLKENFIMSCFISAVFVSLSRSFWLGMAAGVGILSLLSFFLFRPALKTIAQALGQALLSIFTAICILGAVIFIPSPWQDITGEELADVFSKRAQSSDAAVSSRWKLLDPMIEVVKNHPVIGSGFGSTVSFQSDDPRIREQFPDGTWTTYSMEWGWIELWLKMGVLGPLSFLIIFFYLIRFFALYRWTDQTWLGLGFISACVFLVVTHFFSPYLNHPIGLGFILFCLPFLGNRLKSPVSVLEVKNSALLKPEMMEGAVVFHKNTHLS